MRRGAQPPRRRGHRRPPEPAARRGDSTRRRRGAYGGRKAAAAHGRRDPSRRGRVGGEEGLGVEVVGRGGCGFEEEGCVGGDGWGHGADGILLSLFVGVGLGLGGKAVEREGEACVRAGLIWRAID